MATGASNRTEVISIFIDVFRRIANSHPARWQFRQGRITRPAEIIAPTADCSFACRALPNINRFQVNALGQSVPRSSFGTTRA